VYDLSVAAPFLQFTKALKERDLVKGDIVVSETLGCFALEEHIIDNMQV
jgi:hypothetical protein